MVNAARLEQVIGVIEADLSKWDQSMWAQRNPCGTSYCLAGHAAVLAGKQPLFVNKYDSEPNDEQIAFQTIDGEYIQDVAMEWLDLDEDEANYLFSAFTDDFDKLKIKVKEVINGELLY